MMKTKIFTLCPAFVLGFAALLAAVGAVRADEALDAAAKKGIDYLRTVQAEDGSFSSQMGTGLTSIAILGMLGNGLPIDDPMLSKAVMQQMPVSIQTPNAKSAVAYEQIAQTLMNKEMSRTVKRRGMAAFFSHIVSGKKFATNNNQ